MNEIEKYNESVFENIRHTDECGNEYWEARELQKVLEYKEWRNFRKVLEKAMIACDASKYNTSDHFVEFNKMIEIAKGAQRVQQDYKLSRYESLKQIEKENKINMFIK